MQPFWAAWVVQASRESLIKPVGDHCLTWEKMNSWLKTFQNNWCCQDEVWTDFGAIGPTPYQRWHSRLCYYLSTNIFWSTNSETKYSRSFIFCENIGQLPTGSLPGGFAGENYLCAGFAINHILTHLYENYYIFQHHVDKNIKYYCLYLLDTRRKARSTDSKSV